MHANDIPNAWTYAPTSRNKNYTYIEGEQYAPSPLPAINSTKEAVLNNSTTTCAQNLICSLQLYLERRSNE
jgi:hypothetical protein